MSTWRVAKSLEQLRSEVNALFPTRSKVSDGSIGDAAHASRTSDHNPWVKDAQGIGVVTAVDITEDSERGVAEIVDFIMKTLVANKDPRVKYLIHEGQICRSYDKPGIPAWTWAPYTGSNAHVQHGHISVRSEAKYYDSTKSWGLAEALKPKKVATPFADAAYEAIMRGLAEAQEAENATRMVQWEELRAMAARLSSKY